MKASMPATAPVTLQSRSARASSQWKAAVVPTKPRKARPSVAAPVTGVSAPAMPPSRPDSAWVRSPAVRSPRFSSRARQPRSSPMSRPTASATPSRTKSCSSDMRITPAATVGPVGPKAQ